MPETHAQPLLPTFYRVSKTAKSVTIPHVKGGRAMRFRRKIVFVENIRWNETVRAAETATNGSENSQTETKTSKIGAEVLF